jgi:hypothetical protein
MTQLAFRHEVADLGEERFLRGDVGRLPAPRAIPGFVTSASTPSPRFFAKRPTRSDLSANGRPNPDSTTHHYSDVGTGKERRKVDAVRSLH